jgi:two-component system cell cycle sensor histidine kinase PleC
MRALTTYIFIVLFLLLSAGGYFVYSNHQSALLKTSAENHKNLARGFTNVVWKQYSYKIMPLLTSGNTNLTYDVDVATFGADMESYLKGLDIVAAQIYGPSKQMVLSYSERQDVQVAAPDNDLLSSVVSSQQPVTRYTTGSNGDAMVESIIPVVKDGVVQLMIVVNSDVSSQNEPFITAIAALILAVMLMAVAIYAMGTINIRRAETLIAKQYEENAELASQAASAKEETKQKSQFLANITHELRTPLNAIIGFSDILRTEFVPAPGQSSFTNYISDIHSAGTHLLSLINDILDYSKAEAGKLELELTEVNVVKMIQNCIRLVSVRAEMAQVHISESLPKGSLTITTDGKKFKQVLLNLLSNAVKFTPANGTVQVSVWEDMQSDMWSFEVRDTGIGIAPKDISRAMSPFGQVDNALSRKFEGTGLGLPLTKKFVELMGGVFQIDSEEGKGTVVTFSLPREYKPQEGVIAKHVA